MVHAFGIRSASLSARSLTRKSRRLLNRVQFGKRSPVSLASGTISWPAVPFEEAFPTGNAQGYGSQTGRGLTRVALVGFRGDGAHHLTRAAIRAPSRAFPRRRALCTNSKKPR